MRASAHPAPTRQLDGHWIATRDIARSGHSFLPARPRGCGAAVRISNTAGSSIASSSVVLHGRTSVASWLRPRDGGGRYIVQSCYQYIRVITACQALFQKKVKIFFRRLARSLPSNTHANARIRTGTLIATQYPCQPKLHPP